jgi:hypothetical protein
VGQKVSAGKHFSQKYYGGQKTLGKSHLKLMFEKSFTSI